MTQEIYGSSWKDNVVALAVENGDIEMTTGNKETLIVRAIFGSAMLPERKSNDNFTFAKEEAPAATASDTEIDPSTGVITAGSQSGSAVFSVTLKGAPNVDPAYVLVTVSGG